MNPRCRAGASAGPWACSVAAARLAAARAALTARRGSRAGAGVRPPSPPRLPGFQAKHSQPQSASAPTLLHPRHQPPPTPLPLPSLREAKLGRLSGGAADRSANPSRGPANESRSPESPWPWLFLITLCLKWDRGGVSPPPLNANTMRRAVGFPALCLLLNLHAAGKRLPGRAGSGDEMGRKLHMLKDSRKSLPLKESRIVLTGKG